MNKAALVLSPRALEDLDEIWWFIAQDNVDAAERFEQRIRQTLCRLAENPGIGHGRTDITDKPVLLWPAGSYFVICDPRKRPIEILRVLQGARDIESILESQ
jgi:plasmid stabilization system protein ParE